MNTSNIAISSPGVPQHSGSSISPFIVSILMSSISPFVVSILMWGLPGDYDIIFNLTDNIVVSRPTLTLNHYQITGVLRRPR